MKKRMILLLAACTVCLSAPEVSRIEQADSGIQIEGFCDIPWQTSFQEVRSLLSEVQYKESADFVLREEKTGVNNDLSFIEMNYETEIMGNHKAARSYVFVDDQLAGGRFSYPVDGPMDVDDLLSGYIALYGEPGVKIDIGDAFPFFLWVDDDKDFIAAYTGEAHAYVYYGQAIPSFISYASAFQSWYEMNLADEIERVVREEENV